MYSCVLFTLVILIYGLKSYVCDMEGRVVGGDYTTIREFPHAVFLNIQTEGSMFICGSSVLNQAVLLTAAHCFEIINERSIVRAFGGHHDIYQVTMVRNAKRVYRHSKYNSKTIVNDIALVKLKDELPLGKFIKRVILRPSILNKEGILAGWGAIDEDMSEFTFKLKAVQQKIKSHEACSKVGEMKPGMLCAGSFKRHDSRPSKGDSGSGLVTDDYQIVGVVSYVVNAFPALIIYTNVSYYYDWIEEKAQKISCPLNNNK